MAIRRGATTPPLIVPERPTMNLGSAPVRYKAQPVQGEPAADELRAILDPLIKADDAAGAEAQLLIYAPQLSAEARAEAGQRVAFVYYVLGLDVDARRVADTWRQGATGEWAAQARLGFGLSPRGASAIANRASRAFQQVAPPRPAARASRRRLLLGARAPSRRAAARASVEPLLQAAATQLSRKLLRPGRARNARHGHEAPCRSATSATTRPIDQLPNVQRAMELAQIGEPALAEEMLRHQAKIGLAHRASCADPARQEARPSGGAAVARQQRPARRARPTPPTAIPTRAGARINGWRVDPALAFGHIVQESAFRRTAVSTAGAVGLMQVLPVTAQLMSRNRGVPSTTVR